MAAHSAQRPCAVELLMLQRRVDRQKLERLLVVDPLEVDANHTPLVRLDLGIVALPRLH